MANITQKGATGPLSFQANGQYQSATSPSTTPGAYGTSATYNISQLVGTRWDLNDGREVILVSTGSATVASPGLLYQDAALLASHANLAVSAFTAYSGNGNVPASVTVTVVNGGAITANQYQNGYVIVNDGGQTAGQGQTLRISSHGAASTSGANLAITLEESPNVALTTSSKVTLIPAHGKGVIISPTSPTNVPCGIALYPIAASDYGFMTSRGLCSALSDSKVASVGEPISPSVTTAGTVTLATQNGTTGNLTSAIIGSAAYTAVSAKSYPVYLSL